VFAIQSAAEFVPGLCEWGGRGRGGELFFSSCLRAVRPRHFTLRKYAVRDDDRARHPALPGSVQRGGDGDVWRYKCEAKKETNEADVRCEVEVTKLSHF
jgi:hypothetical protein